MMANSKLGVKIKILCQNCGCHFKNEFKLSLKPECNFWGERGMGNLPVKDKQKLWDWYFSAPFDEIMIKNNLNVLMSLMAVPIKRSVQFKDIVENWETLSEKDKQQFQKDYFQKYGSELPDKKMIYDPAEGL